MLFVALTVLFQAACAMSVLAADKPALTIDQPRTALLIMDYQNDILNFLPEKERAPLLEKASAILKEARRAGIQVIYVVVRFRDGYPDEEVHRVLTGKVFPGQAAVVSTQEFLKTITGK